MAGAVNFVYADWVASYPEFTAVSTGMATNFFNGATGLLANQLNPVPTLTELTSLLYLLTAHVAALFTDPSNIANASATNSPVGRLSNASEGSVSVQYENNYAEGSAQYYQQTKYGALYWAMTTKYRTARYRPPCGPLYNPQAFRAWPR